MPTKPSVDRSPPTPDATPAGFVIVRGARVHNLRDVDVDVPRNALVVFTGVSGSGKSSLAFGTIFAEAQRRYLESVSPYARRLIEQAGTPDVDSIEGLPPAVALQQQRGTPNARSSVGSVTTLSSLLRMLYSRAGTYPADQPMLYAEDFSPNTPQGACPRCHGLGHLYDATEQSMVPDDALTIRERAIAAWPPAWHGQNLRDILVSLGHDVDTPWRDLPRKTREWILFTEEQPTVPVYAGLTPEETRAALRKKLEPSYQGTFSSARRYVMHTLATTQSAVLKRRVSRYLVGQVCPSCRGKRLKPQALTVTVAGHDIGALSAMSMDQVSKALEPLAQGQARDPAAGETWSREATRKARAARVAAGGPAHDAAPDVRRTQNNSEEKRLAAQQMARDIRRHIGTLQDLGLGYLSLERSTPTLSAGELQRIRLATQIRSHLFGVIYVLDEPTAGLHPADGEALIGALETLRDSGNSVFVVEHDIDMMRRADWLVDVGPGAGEQGGRVLYSGKPESLVTVAESCTARHLQPAVRHPRALHELREPRGWLELRDVSRNNLDGVDVRFPLGLFTSVTGVSGSGKSSLVTQALVDLVGAALGHEPVHDEAAAEESEPLLPTQRTRGRIHGGLGTVKRLVWIDQKPIGRTPRSNLATYTGLFDGVRRLFAATASARRFGYDAGRFSFNVAKGRCATCEGEGFVSVEMLFMPSVYAPCPSCHGARYDASTLRVKLRGLTIAEVLGLTVDAACEFFAEEPAVHRPLQLLQRIGLGYLRLGQPATELSGGEAQRIKLATELQRPQRGSTLYVLDEPTTGLHPSDVEKLMRQLQSLVEAGNTVIAVEHDLQVIAQSDWVVDLGPGAGSNGGRIVAEGPPDVVADNSESQTAVHLRRSLAAGARTGGTATR